MRWEDLKKELDAIPGVRESFDRYYPYHDLSLEIAGVRSDLDMTQTEFGALVGIPQSTVARLESGQQNPSVGMLQRIAKATDMELAIEFRPPKRERRRTNRRKTDESTTTEPTRAEPVAASSRTR
jgi:transcriptional regulator with XRE-family HTH domain